MNERVRPLDGIRAVSVFGVILSGFGWLAPFGWVGVLAFYVLSGFLITRILFAGYMGSFQRKYRLRLSNGCSIKR